jgi:hypothetical protein
LRQAADDLLGEATGELAQRPDVSIPLAGKSPFGGRLDARGDHERDVSIPLAGKSPFGGRGTEHSGGSCPCSKRA